MLLLALVDYSAFPAVRAGDHGSFNWGPDALASARNAAILESLERMAYFALRINPQARAIWRSLHDKHFLREHAKDAYYGQPKEKK